MSAPTPFQRARSVAQVAARRAAILDVARELLDTALVAEVSLREIGRRVGLSKSNVVRYFPTREAIFMELYVQDLREALDGLEARAGDPSSGPGEAALTLASAVTSAFEARPRLCELLATSQAVLERNVSTAQARECKLLLLTEMNRLAAVLSAGLPGLTPATAFEAAGMTWLVVAGIWPMTRPTPEVAAALDDPDLAVFRVDFGSLLTRTLHATYTGLQQLPQ